MSYSSSNELGSTAKLNDVVDLVELLGYKYSGTLSSEDLGNIRCYYWSDEDDYRSWSGVELSIYKNKGIVFVETRTAISRSYFDLEHQNKTIRLLRKLFGGSFQTDEGKGRYMHPGSGPPTPSASGCHLAFQRFGANLITAGIFFENRNFKGASFKPKPSGFNFMDQMNPWLVSNNLLLPFLVSTFEDYWKSTYIALLKYSNKKEKILKSGRLSAEHLTEVSIKEKSIEQAFAETLPFQRISAICKHFEALDSKLNFSKVLRKPYRRRKLSLFDSLEEMTKLRHLIIHRAIIDTQLTDEFTKGLFHNLNITTIRCYKHLTKTYGWTFDQGWAGNF